MRRSADVRCFISPTLLRVFKVQIDSGKQFRVSAAVLANERRPISERNIRSAGSNFRINIICRFWPLWRVTGWTLLTNIRCGVLRDGQY